tara:strand:- start:463 stop:729 length:267 start_codon:yes stop_codon:yes gene_type:complete
MVINELTLTSIGSVLTDFVGEERKNTPVTSKEAIALDLAGVQLLIAYNKENSVKIDVKLNESSLELLMKTGFHNYINGDRFFLNKDKS